MTSRKSTYCIPTLTICPVQLIANFTNTGFSLTFNIQHSRAYKLGCVAIAYYSCQASCFFSIDRAGYVFCAYLFSCLIGTRCSQNHLGWKELWDIIQFHLILKTGSVLIQNEILALCLVDVEKLQILYNFSESPVPISLINVSYHHCNFGGFFSLLSSQNFPGLMVQLMAPSLQYPVCRYAARFP